MNSLDPPAIKHMISHLLSASPDAPPIAIPTDLDLPPTIAPNAQHSASPLALLAAAVRALYAPTATFVHPLFAAHGHAQITAMYAQWRALYTSTRVDYQSISIHLHAGDLSRDRAGGGGDNVDQEDQAQSATVLVECTQYPRMIWPIHCLLGTKWVPPRLHLVAKLQLMRALVPVDDVECAMAILGGPSPRTQEVTIMQRDHRVYVRRWVIVEHTDFYASSPIMLVLAPRGFWCLRTVLTWMTLGFWSLLSSKWVRPVADWLTRVEWNPRLGVEVMDLDGGGKADKVFDKKEE